MNSKYKVTEIREQRQEKWRDSKRQIKMEGWGVREVYGSRRDEAIKEKDEMVLFRFPFWEFLSLCEAARSLSRNCVLCVPVCVCGCAQGGGREKIVCKNVRCRNVWESFPLCLCQTALIMRLWQLRAGARAKPSWTRLNQAWTYSAQHALCFKPWLIGPEASQSPFPAVTATGLRKERDGEREERTGPRNSFYTSSRWINTICIVLMFEILATLLLAQLAGSRTLHLTADNEAIWPPK